MKPLTLIFWGVLLSVALALTVLAMVESVAVI